MKRVLSIIVAAVMMVFVLPVSHVSAYVTGTVGQYNTISAGGDHSMVIKTDHTLWTWGLNNSGQLGYSRVSDQSKWGDYYQTVPKKVMNGVETDKAIAKPSTSAVLVDGRKISFDVYNINDNNYFKLRDLAAVLSGSGKAIHYGRRRKVFNFGVEWDGKTNTIAIDTSESYVE